MAFLEIFERVANFAADQGGYVIFERGPALAPDELKRLKAKSQILIPDELCQFYSEVGDGLDFRWATVPWPNWSEFDLGDPDLFAKVSEGLSGGDGSCGIVDVCQLSELVADLNKRSGWRTEWSDQYDYRFTSDPQIARQTAQRMRKWVHFHDEGNGDTFCLDGGISPASVVFDRHDWMDGGTGANGHVMAESLLTLYHDWATVCFQRPSSAWWPTVFDAPQGIKWESDEFVAEFRLPSAT